MSISLINHATASASGSNTATTAGFDSTGATLLVVGVCTFGFNASTITLTDSFTNTWAHIANFVTGNFNVCLFHCQNPSAVGAAHTVSAHGSSAFPTIFFAAFSGTKTTGQPENSSGNTAASGTTVQPGSLTPAENGALLVSVVSLNSAGAISIAGDTYAVLDSRIVTGAGELGAMAYEIQATAAALNPTWTHASSASSALQAIFAPTAGVVAGPLFLPPTLGGLGAGGPFFSNPIG